MQLNRWAGGFVCLLLVFFTSSGYGQNRYTFPQVTPLSPNAASLGKYGDIPVSLSNGMANLSVPLFEVKIGSFTLPVNLSYHNNGLKVTEIPSFVGLGWDISTLGVINHQQRGNDDFAEDGSHGLFSPMDQSSKQKLDQYFQGQMTAQQQSDYLEAIMQGELDGEYDLYTFSFMGQAGTFYLDADQNIISVPKTNLKITKAGSYFTIVDESGNQYFFGLRESSEYKTIPEDDLTARKGFNGTASYLLYKITTADNRAINFGYTSYPFTYQVTHKYATLNDRPKLFPECPDDNFVTNLSAVTVTNYMLTEITFEGGRIEFNLSANARADINNIAIPAANVPYLDGVKLQDDNGTVIYDFALLHSYFSSNARLRLDGVLKKAGNKTADSWQFDYYDDVSLPAINGGSTDHWGYFNGGGNPYGIPGADYSKFVLGWNNERMLPDYGFVGKRSTGACISGMLKTITYPTGGKSVLTYEPNQIKYKRLSEMKAALDPFLIDGVKPENYIQPIPVLYASTDDNMEKNAFTGEFTIEGYQSNILISAYRTYDPYNLTYSYVKLSETPDGPNLLHTRVGETCVGVSCTMTKNITLLPGTYYYTLIRNQEESLTDRGSAWLDVKYLPDTFPTPVPFYVGGCRIASIENISNTGARTKKRYEYADLNGTLNFRSKPVYFSRTNVGISRGGTGGTILCDPCNQEFKIHDESILPLTGNPVEYANVTEYNDNAGSNGKIEYTFSYTDNLSAQGSFPYVVPFLATWSGGQLKNKKIFKSIPHPNGTGYTYDIVEEDGFGFETDAQPATVRGVKADYATYCTAGPIFRDFSTTTENYQTERFSPKSSTKTLYDNSGNITQTSVNTYASTAHTLPTSVLGTNSKNEEVKQLASYSFEYATGTYTDAAAQGIKALIDRNMLAPVENLTVKKINGADYVVSGKLMMYGNLARLDKVYELAIKTPVLLNNVTRSFINSSGQFIKDSRYEERAAINLYDSYSNVLQQQYANNVVESYIYDYNSMYVVASVTNADAASVAYTSFETGVNGNWTVSGGAVISSAFTGYKAFQLNTGSITKSGLLANKTYLVTYWISDGAPPLSINGTVNNPRLLKTARGWKCYEHTISGVTQISIAPANAVIDELRLCPEGAVMTTYTYDPFVGITHHNDLANNVTYYEHDAFRRLWLIRDLDRNILKQYEYEYQSNQLDGANWVKTGNTQCKPCSTNAKYTMDVRQLEERDNNPNSLTAGNTRWIDDGVGNCTITAGWVNTTTPVRCKRAFLNGPFTGEQEQEQIDENNCSSTFNSTRWVVVGINCAACGVNNWVPTGNTRCLLDQYNHNTGYVEQEERKQSLYCSGETRWVNIGFRPDLCLPPCYYCQGPTEGVKCVGTECESGVKVYTGSYQNGPWIYCVYHYEFSDGTWSENYSEASDNWCVF